MKIKTVVLMLMLGSFSLAAVESEVKVVGGDKADSNAWAGTAALMCKSILEASSYSSEGIFQSEFCGAAVIGSKWY